MKDAKSIITIIAISVVISIIAGYAAGFFVYREYKQKTAYLDEQARSTMDKFGELEGGLKELYVSIENTVSENKMEREDLLSAIEKIKENLKEWERGYRTTLSELKGEIEDLKIGRLTRMVEKLQDEVDDFKMKMQDLELKDEVEGVDLGKISVGK
ncbi:MAG: hypothetical protein HQ566_00220 [Candidatus Omnitrophica bacterium]|nr:hypothetical protein [Candidatus Omnitrophota bacterium]